MIMQFMEGLECLTWKKPPRGSHYILTFYLRRLSPGRLSDALIFASVSWTYVLSVTSKYIGHNSAAMLIISGFMGKDRIQKTGPVFCFVLF